jgi:hypothetical protein
MILVDLGMSTIPGILRDPRTAEHILEAAGTMLECLWETYAFGHGP